MRILALLTEGFGRNGGIARYNRDLVSALCRSPAVSDVTVLPRFGDIDAPRPDRARQLPAVRGRLEWSLRALQIATGARHDIVFCGHLNAVPLAAVIARLTACRLWVQAHGIEAWQSRGSAIRSAVEQADLVTAVSRYTRLRLMSWCGLPPERVRVLPNTISSAFAPRPRRDDLIARYGLEGRKVILTVGRLSSAERYKGHDRIIAALPMVLARCPTATFLVAGSGDDSRRIEMMARESGLSDHVILAGAIPDRELPDVYALADVFAMPSTGEGFGIVFLEAARSGLPVIGGNRDGSVDALADGCIGRAVDPSSSSALAEALVGALEGRLSHAPGNVGRFAFDNFALHVDALVAGLAAGPAS